MDEFKRARFMYVYSSYSTQNQESFQYTNSLFIDTGSGLVGILKRRFIAKDLVLVAAKHQQ